MVRNEREPDGTSISERYGRPVTASDVEDLLYSERVPSGTILKVMRAVRSAISWSRTQAARPWAGELEHGLTRQEDERREQRKERERALQEIAAREIPADDELTGHRAAAVAPASSSVNSPGERAEAVWAAQVLDWQRRDAAARSQEAPVTAEAPVPLPTAPPAVTEAPESLPGPQEAQPAVEEPEEVLAEEPAMVFTPAAVPAAAAPAQDAPAEPAAPPAALVTGLPGATAPPAVPEAAAGLLAPQPASKTCVKCNEPWPMSFFQRDTRNPDGHRARCKRCTSSSDEFRRRMVRLRKSVTEMLAAAEDVQDALESPSEALTVPGDPAAPPGTERASEAPPEAVQEVLPPDAGDVPGPVVPWVPEVGEETVASVIGDFRQQLEQEFAEDIASGKIVVLPPGREILENEEEPGKRQCSRCGVPKYASGFYLRQDGRSRNVCVECERKASRDRRAAKRSSSA